MTSRAIYLGFDPRECEAFAVARDSIESNSPRVIPIYGLVLDDLRASGLYARPTTVRIDNKTGRRQMWDDVSEAPMATEFANSRFLIGHLAGRGYAMFADCDVLVRGNVTRLFDWCEKDQSKAVWCVKHEYVPKNALKMDGQQQTKYARKNWSSVMVWNCDHPSNKALTVDLINSKPGRDLHRFFWLDDSEIGEVGPEWNYLVGVSPCVSDPCLVHFTNGGPWEPGYERVEYADEWRRARNRWANAACRTTFRKAA
jgi:hypothetical protein